ncbi:MAG: phosphatase domain-containing protein [Candidatus Riflebacteria bacterium]
MLRRFFLRITFLLIIMQFLLNAAVEANDLFDLRILPGFASSTVRIDGVIVGSSKKDQPNLRRNNFSGLRGDWLASGTVEINCGAQKKTVDVNDGEFTVGFSGVNVASLTVSVESQGSTLYQENFAVCEKPEIMVISDIDDTILVSDVRNRIKLVYNSLFKRYDSREPVSGTPQLYRQLQAARPAHFIYLSSSPAFLSRPLKIFLKNHKFPPGSLVLKKSVTDAGHESHKTDWLKTAMTLNPRLPVILIGDSGEKDPEIYSSFVKSLPNPKLVRAVIIHEVTDEPERLQTLEHISSEMKKVGVLFIYWQSIEELKKNLIIEGLLR